MRKTSSAIGQMPVAISPTSNNYCGRWGVKPKYQKGHCVMALAETFRPDLDPSIPRVMCPRCGTHMRLAQVGPDVVGHNKMKFDCGCGFEYQMSAAASVEARI